MSPDNMLNPPKIRFPPQSEKNLEDGTLAPDTVHLLGVVAVMSSSLKKLV